MRKLLILSVFVLALFSVASAQFTTFTGSLSTPAGITATGYWSLGFSISWEVELQSDNSWLYTYKMTDLNGNALTGSPSHFTLEVSPNVTSADFWGYSGNVVEFGDKDGISSAMKLDWQADTYSFYSNRVPVWGDFYSKDGDAGGMGRNTAYNSGFGLDDPLVAASNGSVNNKILRPDTGVIPEPSTMILLGIGLAGYGARRRFKK